MKRWLLAGALAVAAAGQGLGSDLPPPAVPAPPRAPAAYVPPVSPVYNWKLDAHRPGCCPQYSGWLLFFLHYS